MTIQDRTMTAAAFWKRVAELNTDTLYELVNGEMIEIPPPRRKNSRIAVRISTFLTNYAMEKDAGTVLGADGGYTLTEYDVRVPDASFVAKDRISQMDAAEADSSIFAPNLVVEVISPSETPRTINDKTALYLNAGVKQVWNVYPEDAIIEVWEPGADSSMRVVTLRTGDTLTSKAVLPGFALKLDDVFADTSA